MKLILKMLALTFLLSLTWFDSLVYPVPAAYAAVNCNAAGIICKSGVLSSNETWTSANVYVITGNVTVPAGRTLTIQTGTIVKFQYYGRSLIIDGTLNVSGTAASRVYFTGDRDDTLGGDTNGDGGSTAPNYGDWASIYFTNGSSGNLSYAELRYGGWNNQGAINLSGSSPTINNVSIRYSASSAISALPTDQPVITNFSTTFTRQGGLTIRGGTIGTNTTWGNTGVAYILDGNVTIAPNITLTINPGVVVKFEYYGRSLIVNGRLNVSGTATGKVYFTSSRDDTLGGDTNGDGGNTAPNAGDWQSVFFTSGSSGNVNHFELRYSGWNNQGAINLSGSSPTLSNVSVRSSSSSAISALATDQPVITNFSTAFTPQGGLTIRGGTIGANTTWSNTGIAYIIDGNVTVAPNVTLTIGPGVVVKFQYYGRSLIVNGGLVVNGTATSKVYFTGNRDDTLGGDTNGDGGNTAPNAGDWASIYFTNGSTGNLNYGELRYGGWNSQGAINLNGSSPTLNNVSVRNSSSSAISALATDQPVITNFSASFTPQGGLTLRGGAIGSNTTWSNTGVVYILDGDVTIPQNTTLTIQPGVVVKFQHYSRSLIVEGALNVNGTASNRVYFSSNRDDTLGGDTNGDGTSTVPRPGDWNSIDFRQGSSGSVNYAEIRYGGANGAVRVASTSPTISNSILRHNTIALYSNGAGAAPVVNGSDFFYNAQFAAVAANAGALLATNNWWGDRLGPNVGGSNPAGQPIQGNVTFTGWSVTPRNLTNGSKSLSASVLINNSMALYSSGSEAVLAVNNCTHIRGNSQYGARAVNNSQINAPLTWWGSPTGPNDGVSGAGDRVEGNVGFSPWARDVACATASGDSGAIEGRVTNTAGQALTNIRVQFYRQEGTLWKTAGFAWSGADGRYQATLLAGSYRVHFIDPLSKYLAQYYNRVSTFNQATPVNVKAETTQTNINAILQELPPPPLIERGCGRAEIDILTGRIIISFPRGCQDTVEIIVQVSCPNGGAPGNVSLQINDRAFPMTHLGEKRYKVSLNIPADLPGNGSSFTLRINAACGVVAEGQVIRYDPSGRIRDKVSGQYITGALVNLYRVPGALPDEAEQTKDCRTVNTRPVTGGGIYGNWSGLPAAVLNEAHWLDPALSLINGTAEISPTLNPQITGKDGYYGWDVVKGCWYIQVQAAGYEPLVSPIVGVPPAVTDLDLSLTPELASPSNNQIYLPLLIK